MKTQQTKEEKDFGKYWKHVIVIVIVINIENKLWSYFVKKKKTMKLLKSTLSIFQ